MLGNIIGAIKPSQEQILNLFGNAISGLVDEAIEQGYNMYLKVNPETREVSIYKVFTDKNKESELIQTIKSNG